MRKALIYALTILFILLVFTSCRPRKKRCPAYGQIQKEACSNSTENRI